MNVRHALLIPLAAAGTYWLSATPLAGEQPASPPVRTGVVDLTIGAADETREEYSFSSIMGATFGPGGRMVVTDFKDNLARVFDSTGRYTYAVGRAGAGPGEFNVPLAASMSEDGLLWIVDEGNKRINAYTLGPTRATFTASVRFDHGRPKSNRAAPIGFDQQGRIFSVGSASQPMRPGSVIVRVLLDRTGAVVRTDTIPEPPGDSVGTRTVTKPLPKPAVGYNSYMYYQPFGPAFVVAYGPGGEIARAVTSRYDVEWLGPDRTRLRTIRRQVVGPELSDAEKKRGRQDIVDFLEMAKVPASQVPPLPSRKAPIKSIAFDASGRLWIERATRDGEPREADLFDREGRLTAVMRWPREVRVLAFDRVAVNGNHVLGYASDSSDVQRLVRLRFR